jgi:citrate lyase subunit beta/citryl-CoA lyase
VPIVNEEYRAPRSDVEWARKVIDGYDEAKRVGRASFAIDGKMIDIPVVVRAERLLERERQIEAREQKLRAAPG